jgi:hypothetical protein
MAWSIEFFPKECNAISMSINNQGWDATGDGYAWKAAEGRANKPLPAQWRDLRKIHVWAAADPRGKNASLRVLWDGSNRQTMDFDDDEDHDVDAP